MTNETTKPIKKLKEEGFKIYKSSRLMFDFDIFKNREIQTQITKEELMNSFKPYLKFKEDYPNALFFSYLIGWLKADYNSEPDYEIMKRQLNNAPGVFKRGD